MAWAVVGAAAVTVVGGYVNAQSQKRATNRAAKAQTAAEQMAIAEQQRQFEAMQELVKPYVQAGKTALSQQQDLIGLNGNQAQQQAINQLQNSSTYNNQVANAEKSLLQNASATGGLRGGNTQGALATVRPAILDNLINQQYTRLGNIAQMGQNSATMQGTQSMQQAQLLGNSYQNIGAIQAGAALGNSRANQNMWNSFANGVSSGLTAYANRPQDTGTATPMATDTYNYNNDAGGLRYSQSGADIMARR